MKNSLGAIALAAGWLYAASACADEVTLEKEILFVRRVAPLLHEKCLACHGDDVEQMQGGLDMRSLSSIMSGGDSGQPGIVPGKPDRSPLYLAITRAHEEWSAMPPKEADQLNQQQIKWIEQWIATGAVWPSAARSQQLARANRDAWSAEDGVVVKTSAGLSAAWSNRLYRPELLWAYAPVNKPILEQQAAAAIDHLLLSRMPEGLAPAPAAHPRSLIRRATFDLTGLPPAPEEVAAFEAEHRADPKGAMLKLVNRLLDSPHYGERMAQHWLDVVRYADSSGFANDYQRGNAWRYRDYVVRAFNSDKAYDQFIREQIAGDEIDASNAEHIIATGMLRMGPWELTGMEVAKVARQRFLDDVTNSVGETFLAQALQCARCHDHKFDPIPTRDYYSVQAVFATTQLVERAAGFLASENVAGFDEKESLKRTREAYLKTLHQLDQVLLDNAQRWFSEHGKDPAIWNAAVDKARTVEPAAPAGKPQRDFGGVFAAVRNELMKRAVSEADFPPKFVGFTPQQYGMERVARKGLERLRWELERYEAYALAVCNGLTPDVKSVNAPVRMTPARLTHGELEDTSILAGGDPFSPTEKVEPGVLSLLGWLAKDSPTAKKLLPSPIPTGIDGRRRAFAEWVASPDNPLTTRAVVNRIWMWHFQEPIAGNPNNFGSTGKPPTHPELLDWLAASFVEQGWSFKNMHRMIMTSDAYQRSTEHPQREILQSKDPIGTSYAVYRPRRLSAEELRDAMLVATGELNRTLGGIPNRPEINLEAALQPRQVMGTFAAAWTPNPLPQDRHRRSLYALKLRGLSDPLMEVFNAPAPDFSCERRESSTVTPQAFSLFNAQQSYARSLALAARVDKEVRADEAAVTRCFELVLGRSPRSSELIACVKHWHEMEAVQANTHFNAGELPLEVVREAVEENTGEKFTFREKLSDYAQFVPDLQPSAVSVRVRALADVCLVLFNSNEFAYVY